MTKQIRNWHLMCHQVVAREDIIASTPYGDVRFCRRGDFVIVPPLFFDEPTDATWVVWRDVPDFRKSGPAAGVRQDQVMTIAEAVAEGLVTLDDVPPTAPLSPEVRETEMALLRRRKLRA